MPSTVTSTVPCIAGLSLLGRREKKTLSRRSQTSVASFPKGSRRCLRQEQSHPRAEVTPRHQNPDPFSQITDKCRQGEPRSPHQSPPPKILLREKQTGFQLCLHSAVRQIHVHIRGSHGLRYCVDTYVHRTRPSPARPDSLLQSSGARGSSEGTPERQRAQKPECCECQRFRLYSYYYYYYCY